MSKSVGRHQIYTDDIISGKGRGPFRVRSANRGEYSTTFTGVNLESDETEHLTLIMKERATRHEEA